MTILADRIEKRIRNIPVSNGGYISFCQQYLYNTMSRALLRKIAEEAAAEAEASNQQSKDASNG